MWKQDYKTLGFSRLVPPMGACFRGGVGGEEYFLKLFHRAGGKLVEDRAGELMLKFHKER